MNTSYDYDIIIVGAGPGGSNLARMYKGSARILLLNGFPKDGKVCAGLLSPDAQDLFARYDLTLPSSLLSSPQLFRVRTCDLQTKLTRDYRRSYLNLDRRGLDEYLRSLAAARAEVLHAVCLKVRREANGFSLLIRTEHGEKCLTCQTVVGADGASSVVRRDLFPSRRLPRYTAIQQWFEADGNDAFYSCVFDSSTSDSCSWIFFKDNALIFGGAFPAKQCRSAFESQKEKLIEQGLLPRSISKKLIKTEACSVAMPTSPFHIFEGRDGAYLLGEAAGLISPSSLEGISYAMRSGEALADAFSRETEPSSAEVLFKYKRNLLPLRIKVGMRCIKRSILCNRFLRTIILRSGICSLPEKSVTDASTYKKSIETRLPL